MTTTAHRRASPRRFAALVDRVADLHSITAGGTASVVHMGTVITRSTLVRLFHR
ncbi:Hypothetical protein A7982_10991 [Minicystis rosea]|nr:Hypothetical protein A7982_10991 [Minicystis rosea]